MLHKEVVESTLWDLLIHLMENPLFNSFYLVGGTSLALQIGHRVSVDIDLFGHQEINEIEFSQALTDYGKIKLISKTKNILIFSINDIKVDFVNYHYPWIEEPTFVSKIRLASIKDIAAMKINAIVGRGSKKDFIDIYYLLKIFSYDELLGFYEKKYPDGNLFAAQKSIQYFEDADKDVSPHVIENISWEKMKHEIILKTN